jgi:hypothetical protein
MIAVRVAPAVRTPRGPGLEAAVVARFGEEAV